MPAGITDTHIHIWDFDKAEYEWLNNDTSILKRNYAIEEMDAERLAAGITAGVLVQAANNVEDTDWMLAVAAHTAWLKGVVGWLPLTNTEATGIAINSYIKNNYFKGVRHLVHDEPDAAWLLQPAVLESLRLLRDNGLTYDMVATQPAHMETLLRVAAAVPGLKLVLDHASQPPLGAGNHFGRWGTLMKAAADHPGIHVKISGLGTAGGNFSKRTAADMEPAVEFVLTHFGEDRCFCGSDWPVSLLANSYSGTWQWYTGIIAALATPAQQQKIFSENAHRFYNL